MELGFVVVEKVYRLMQDLKDKGFCPLLVTDEDKIKLEVQFENDSYDYIMNYLKDWMLFNNSIVSFYYLEKFYDGFTCYIDLKEVYM